MSDSQSEDIGELCVSLGGVSLGTTTYKYLLTFAIHVYVLSPYSEQPIASSMNIIL